MWRQEFGNLKEYQEISLIWELRVDLLELELLVSQSSLGSGIPNPLRVAIEISEQSTVRIWAHMYREIDKPEQPTKITIRVSYNGMGQTMSRPQVVRILILLLTTGI